MDERGLRKAASVLSRRHGIRVLHHLSSGEWRIASEISRALEVHTSTVSNLLAPMYELGLLQRRIRTSRNRSTFEYRMPTTRIALEYDFQAQSDLVEERVASFVACLENVLGRVERLGWPGIAEQLETYLETTRDNLSTDVSARLRKENATGLKRALAEIQRGVVAILAETVGPGAAARVFEMAADEAARGRKLTPDPPRLELGAGGML